jgi:hypothetical protein
MGNFQWDFVPDIILHSFAVYGKLINIETSQGMAMAKF